MKTQFLAFASFVFIFFALDVFAQDVCSPEKQHPIVFVPGLFGSALDVKLDLPEWQKMPHDSCPRTTNGTWQRLWISGKYAVPIDQFDCMMRYLSHNISADGSSIPSVAGCETRMPYFGHTACIDPLDPDDVFGSILSIYGHYAKRVHEMGYVDNKTFFVAGYDWSLPPTPQWLKDTKELIEKAVETTGKKVVLMSHSMGGPFTYIFLMSQTQEWRNHYIQHYIPVSPVTAGAEILSFAMITNQFLGISTLFKSLGSVFRHLPAAYFIAPNVKYAKDKVIAYVGPTPYTSNNISIILEKVGIKDAQKKLEALQKPLNDLDYVHPGIPVTVCYTTGKMRSIDYFKWNKEEDIGVMEPLPFLTPGDALVSYESLTYALHLWEKDPKYGSITEGIPLPDTNHGSASTDPKTMKALYDAACDDN